MVVAALIYIQMVQRRFDMLVAQAREMKDTHIGNNRYNNLPGPVWYNRLNPHEFSWRVNDSYFVQVVYFDITDDTKTSLLRTLNARPCGWGSSNRYENWYWCMLNKKERNSIITCKRSYHPSDDFGIVRIWKDLVQLGREVFVAFLMFEEPPTVIEIGWKVAVCVIYKFQGWIAHNIHSPCGNDRQ